jgi:8-oxoguanine deaminase
MQAAAGEVIECEHSVVVPGMVNTHHHMYQSLTRCISHDMPLFGWLKSLYLGWSHLTSEVRDASWCFLTVV